MIRTRCVYKGELLASLADNGGINQRGDVLIPNSKKDAWGDEGRLRYLPSSDQSQRDKIG